MSEDTTTATTTTDPVEEEKRLERLMDARADAYIRAVRTGKPLHECRALRAIWKEAIAAYHEHGRARYAAEHPYTPTVFESLLFELGDARRASREPAADFWPRVKAALAERDREKPAGWAEAAAKGGA